MKRLLTFHFLSVFFFLLISTNLFAQELLDNDFVHQINFSGTAEDYIIPADVTYDRIEFFLDGGDGGKGSYCNIKGGKGAHVKAVFKIGPLPDELRPGGTVRFIVGKRGDNRTVDTAAGGAGGGGGTAILYKNPGATTDDTPSTNLFEADTNWVILAVAGAGGGAFQRRSNPGNQCGSNSKRGQGGQTGTSGGGDGINTGGTNGNGGKANSNGGAGGGYLTGGMNQGGQHSSDDGDRGGVNGGNGGTLGIDGGWGYGGGGSGAFENEGGGGGGGGFSGGGGGVEGNRRGFGGGSFVNDADLDAFRSLDGNHTVSTPKNGYITYKFFSESGVIAKCKNVTVQLDASGQQTFLPSEANDGSYTTDGSTIIGYSASAVATPGLLASFDFDCTDLGDHEFILAVLPNTGSPGFCSFNLSVVDGSMPVALCKNATINLSGSGRSLLFPADIDDGSFDGCSSSILFLDKEEFDCSDIGGNTVELTVQDEEDNTDTCTASVTIRDIIAPVLTGSSLIQTVQLDASGMGSIAPNQVIIGAADNCGNPSLSLSQSSFDCNDIGENTVTVTATDASGNSSSLETFVRVEDNLAPQAVCQNATVSLDDSGNGGLMATDVDGGSTDNCTIQSRSLSQSSFNCDDVGTISVQLTVTDQSGNANTCTANVLVEENILPTALCQDVTIAVDDQGQASLQAADVDGGSSQLCDEVSLSVSPAGFDCSDLGNQEVTLTVTAPNNNQSTCTATVTVVDNTPPVALCKDVTLNLGPGGVISKQRQFFNDGSYDNCGSPTILNNNYFHFNCDDVGERTVRLTVYDENSNLTSSCNATVTIVYNVLPNVFCQSVTVQLDAVGIANLTPEEVISGFSGACGNESSTVNPSSFTCADIGAQVVVVTATDVNGNSSTCSTTVTIEDNTPPVALCKDLTINLGSNGTATRYRGAFNDGSYDNCGSITILNNLFPIVFDCNSIGTSTITLSISDDNNLTNSCTATATVVDDEPPIATCWPATVQLNSDGVGNLNPGQVLFISNDACGIQSRTVSPAEFDCDDIGNQQVVVTLTDNNGNTNTCSTSITVEDNGAPVVTCQTGTIQLNGIGVATLDPDLVKLSEVENCTIASYTLSQPDFDCGDIGETQVILTATDQSGNTGTCSATVTVEDNIPPVAICKDMTLNVGLGPQQVTNAHLDDGSYDNCGTVSVVDPFQWFNFRCIHIGENELILTVTDGNLTSSCTATITVIDNVPPNAFCAPFTLQLDANGVGQLTPDDVLAITSDACGVQSETIDQSDFDCNDIGVHLVIATVTDNQGLTKTCSSSVTVEDNIAPIVTCQAVTLQLDDNETATLNVNQIKTGEVENCTIESFNLSHSGFDCSEIGEVEVTLTATDQSGNTGTCSATVTVLDETPPVALCQDRTINVNDIVVVLPGVPPPPVVIDNGSYDNCGGLSLSFTTEDGSPISIFDGELRFPCNYIGVNTVILTASDGNLSSTCSASLTVVDNQPPTISCETDVVVQLDDTGTATLQIDDVLAIAVDRCGIQSTTLSQDQFDCDDVGSQSITVTVTDNSGNYTDCIAGLIIEDGSVLNAICVSETIELDETGHASVSLSDIDGGSGNACGAAISLSLSQMDFNCDDLGSNTVVLTATDDNGNVSTCSATVIVEDQLAPTMTCNGQVNLFTDPGVCGATHTVSYLEAVDNCEVTLLRYRYRRSNKFGHHYDSSPWSAWMDAPTLYLPLIGYWKIQWEASDESGNLMQCDYLVKIIDNEAPTPVCLNPTVTFNGEAVIEVPGDQLWDEGASSDNCLIDTEFFDVPAVTINCDQAGSVIPVTVTIPDLFNNQASCTANITVEGLPCGWQSDQINCSEIAQAGYDPATGTYNLSAENCYDPNYYSNNDAQNMIQQELCGDGEIIAHVADIDGDAWAGIFMRENNDPDAKMLQLAINNSGLAQRQLRQSTGSLAFKHLFQNQGKHWVRLTRSGNQFSAFLSSDGISWDLVLMTNIPMTNCIQTGLFVSNATPNSTATAWFDNVQITPPTGGNALQNPNFQFPISQVQIQPDFSVYPNPTTGELNLNFHAFMDQPIQVQIFNQQGQLVLSKAFPINHDFTERLHLQQLQDGLYLIQVTAKGSSVIKKFSLIR